MAFDIFGVEAGEIKLTAFILPDEISVKPGFLTRNRYEKVEKPMDTRRAKENAHRHTCSMSSTFFKRNAVDMGLSNFVVGSW